VALDYIELEFAGSPIQTGYGIALITGALGEGYPIMPYAGGMAGSFGDNYTWVFPPNYCISDAKYKIQITRQFILSILGRESWYELPSEMFAHDWSALVSECDTEEIIHTMHTNLAAEPEHDPASHYVSKYPPEYNSTYIKATSEADPTSYAATLAFNPANPLTGDHNLRGWLGNAASQQRVHVDLVTPAIIERLIINNYHHSGTYTSRGAQNFTVWGSNDGDAFAELTYAVDTDWTQIAADISALDEHTAANEVDPQVITLTNAVAYRYYGFKFADNYGGELLGIRRIELQIYVP
jgi:hypothetical protein